MKLDKRITENYKIYSCFDVKEAQEYINTLEGLFNNYEFLCKGDWAPFGVEDEL